MNHGGPVNGPLGLKGSASVQLTQRQNSQRLSPAPSPAPAAGIALPARFPQLKIPGLYIHIPFCFHKCHYCDFYSITRQTPQRMARFVDLLLREADTWTSSFSPHRGPTLCPQTIFFGGGTPSLLPLDDMRRLLRGLKDRFTVRAGHAPPSAREGGACPAPTDDLEWTVECNPATVTPQYCAMLREEGVNRLSFGAQSFNPAELKSLERHHDPGDVPRSIAIARAAGFTRLNLDLIYAIAGQTFESWQDSLERAIALDTEHLSCYALTYEPNTPLAVRKRLGQITPTGDELELRMLHYTRQRLRQAGYEPYEISNYARVSESCQFTVASYQHRQRQPTGNWQPATGNSQCRHNLLYWTGGSYIGLGPSAASHIQGWRWKNRPHLGEWESAIEADSLVTRHSSRPGEAGRAATDIEHLTPLQRAGETIMLELRLQRGVDLPALGHRLGLDTESLYRPLTERLLSTGLLAGEVKQFHLTDRGIELADAIAAEFVALSDD